jgi:hypothetical protein
MEVRPGQHISTILQAMAHNTNTILGDMDLLKRYAEAHKDESCQRIITASSELLNRTYAVFLEGFGEKLAIDFQDPNGHWNTRQPHAHGHERTFTEAVNAATKLARPFETR